MASKGKTVDGTGEISLHPCHSQRLIVGIAHHPFSRLSHFLSVELTAVANSLLHMCLIADGTDHQHRETVKLG